MREIERVSNTIVTDFLCFLCCLCFRVQMKEERRAGVVGFVAAVEKCGVRRYAGLFGNSTSAFKIRNC